MPAHRIIRLVRVAAAIIAVLFGSATLIAGGMGVERAIRAAMIEPLTDDADVKAGLRDLVTAVFG